MPSILIQDTDATLKKFYDIVSEDKYKIFTDMTIKKIDEIFRFIDNADEIEPDIKTASELRASLPTGEVVVLKGKLDASDATKWKISSIDFTTTDGTTLLLKGAFRFYHGGKGFAPGATITQISIYNDVGLTDFFDEPNVITRIDSKNSIVYNGSGNFTGSESRYDRVFSDDWSCQIQYNKTFVYTTEDGIRNTSGRGVLVSLTDPSGKKVLSFDVSDYDMTASDAKAYDAAYREQFFSNADNIKGTEGDDNITSFAGNDTVVSSTGNDTIESGSGNDSVNAGDGTDLIVGGSGPGNDFYDGGKGIDTIRYTSATAAITVNLAKGSASASAGGDLASIGTDRLKGIENLVSGDYSDMLIGSKEANRISGGKGDDTIDGGAGNDTLTGAEGSDVFVFSTKPAANNVDTLDFEPKIDKLQLSGRIFAKLKTGADFLALGVGSDTPTHFLIYNPASGLLSYDADGSGTKAKPVDIAIIGARLDLMPGDVLVI